MHSLVILFCIIWPISHCDPFVSNKYILHAIHETYPFAFSWVQANNYCQLHHGTSLAAYDHVNDLRPILDHIDNNINNQNHSKNAFYIGIVQQNRGTFEDWTEHTKPSHFIRADEKQCPSNNTNTKTGYRQCIDEWQINQPDFWYKMEHCTEFREGYAPKPYDPRTFGANDINCIIQYTYVYGFICSKPVDYTVNNRSNSQAHDNGDASASISASNKPSVFEFGSWKSIAITILGLGYFVMVPMLIHLCNKSASNKIKLSVQDPEDSSSEGTEDQPYDYSHNSSNEGIDSIKIMEQAK